MELPFFHRLQKRRRTEVVGEGEGERQREGEGDGEGKGERVGDGVNVLEGPSRIPLQKERRAHVVPVYLPVCRLDCRRAWAHLSERERRYVHHFSAASWAGARICASQSSEESPAILQLLLLLFSAQPLPSLREASASRSVSPTNWRYLLSYSACFLANLGNYLSFGDCKIVPGISAEDFGKVIESCALKGSRRKSLERLWKGVQEAVYSLHPGERQLGLHPRGVCGYYSRGITAAEIDLVQDWMQQEGMETWNTRLFRVSPTPSFETECSALAEYELRVASAQTLPTETHTHKGSCKIHIVYGDHQVELREVVQHLEKARLYAANANQTAMISEYIRCFETGSIQAHKNSQRYWIRDRSPIVETNIGFIETYRDPMGSRAEFEGLVAVVNEERSAKFAALVAVGAALLDTLPWPREFEKDVLHSPNFTCLEVITFASSGIPAGINMPNYEDIRQTEGFKNFTLGNVLSAVDTGEKVSLIAEEDQTLFKSLQSKAFEMQVSCHELFGHGSGKLFMLSKDGSFNYDRQGVRHPYTGQVPVACYLPGQTWDSVFGTISSAYEECRAECVGMLLCTNPLVLSVFGHNGEAAENMMYVNWLLMVRAGLLALEFYSPETRTWRQAHMRARFAILQVLLRASEQDREANGAESVRESEEERAREGESEWGSGGEGSVGGREEGERGVFRPLVETTRGVGEAAGSSSLSLRLSRAKIRAVGVPALRAFLRRLQVYRATADAAAGRRLFVEVTTVSSEFVALRKAVISKNQQRPIFVQAHTSDGAQASGGVRLEEFEPTHEGVIASFIARYSDWIAGMSS